MSIIEVKNLVKKYGDFTAVADVSFEVKKGEIFGILGPNGAGKTTILEMIEGLRKIDSGEVVLNSVNAKENPNGIKKQIGVQLQASSFFDHLNLKELVTLFASFYNQKVDPIKILTEVELTDKAGSTVKQLSGGQKQRFSIAVALVNDPVVLFLDEPTTGLDPQARRHMWGLIREIQKKGKTIVLTTHYMEEAQELCDRVAIMDQGKIVKLDKPESMVRDLINSGFKKEKVIQEANLEDVFLNLTGHGLREE
jgi:ABC-2 type transport system ATP-binding protein